MENLYKTKIEKSNKMSEKDTKIMKKFMESAIRLLSNNFFRAKKSIYTHSAQ